MKGNVILLTCTQMAEYENGMPGIARLDHGCRHCHGLQRALAW